MWTSLQQIQISLENYVKVIQQREGGKINIRKKDKNPERSAYAVITVYIDLLTSISNCYYQCREIHEEGCKSTVPDNRNFLNHVPPNLDLSLWSICTKMSQFLVCLLWLQGQWALTGTFCTYSILMTACNEHTGIGFWSPNKLSKIWRNLS